MSAVLFELRTGTLEQRLVRYAQRGALSGGAGPAAD